MADHAGSGDPPEHVVANVELWDVDTSGEQLATARRLADQHGATIQLHHASAEDVPEPDGTFDLAVSEYGAAIWCEPASWLREAWRLLRPGGRCNFLGNHPLTPEGDDQPFHVTRSWADRWPSEQAWFLCRPTV